MTALASAASAASAVTASAPPLEQGADHRRRERPDRQQDPRSPVEVRLDHGPLPGWSPTTTRVSSLTASISVLAQRNPRRPALGRRLGVEVVVESTGWPDGERPKAHIRLVPRGGNTNREERRRHLRRRACRPTTTTPVNIVERLHDQLPRPPRPRFSRRTSVSKRGIMTTIHSYTGDQRVLDAPTGSASRPPRALNMIPTETGAGWSRRPGSARSCRQVRPRRPRSHPTGSRPGLTLIAKRSPVEAIEAAVKATAEGELRVQSPRIRSSPPLSWATRTSIFDATETRSSAASSGLSLPCGEILERSRSPHRPRRFQARLSTGDTAMS